MKTHIFALAILTLSTGCMSIPPASHITAQRSDKRGAIIAVASLGAMDRQKLQAIASEFPGGISVANGAELFRITYWTMLKDRSVAASGLLAIPAGVSAPKGMVMYLHGTNATRALAPSQPDRVDGNEEAAVFAANGYYVVLPDYIGLGESKIPHPYLLVRPQVDASVDLLRAVRQFAAERHLHWSSDLFLMGFSQGGQVVSGVHRALQRQGVEGYHLKGSVGIAGPYDLRNTSLPKAFENACRQCVGYLAWATYAYSAYYGEPLGSALTPEYAALVPRLFDGSHGAQEISSALPDNPADIFQPQFLAAIQSAKGNWFTKAMDENETYRWIPKAPFRLYFGEDDVDVTPASSRALFDYAKQKGGNVSLHSLGAVDHQESAALSYAPALKWFDALSQR